jgi:hypothetical protein
MSKPKKLQSLSELQSLLLEGEKQELKMEKLKIDRKFEEAKKIIHCVNVKHIPVA